MNIEGIKTSLKFQHKGTIVILEKLIGDSLAPNQVSPVIISNERNTRIYIPGKAGIPIDSDMIVPFIINGSFSLELSLKYLLFIESNEWFQVHPLNKLFDKLNDKTKNYLKDYMLNKTTNIQTYSEISENAKKDFGIDLNWDIETLLLKSSQSFEKWRYFFEISENFTWFASYLEIKEALDSKIKELG